MRNINFLLILMTSVSCSGNFANEARYIKSFEILEAIGSGYDVINYNEELAKLADSATIRNLSLFKDYDDTLEMIMSELISTAGGVSKDGEYINPTTIWRVESYFYDKNYFRSYAATYFFNELDRFLAQLIKIHPEAGFKNFSDNYKKELYKNFGLQNPEDLFRDHTLVEALHLIDQIRIKVAFAEYEYLLAKLNQ